MLYFLVFLEFATTVESCRYKLDTLLQTQVTQQPQPDHFLDDFFRRMFCVLLLEQLTVTRHLQTRDKLNGVIVLLVFIVTWRDSCPSEIVTPS